MKKIPFSDSMTFDTQTTLFITDLDGTLLTSDATLPTGASDAIWELHSRGVKLTYSTARTIRSASYILEGLPFPAPVSLMNGVLLRDMHEERYINSNLLSSDIADKIISIGGAPFVYTLTPDGELYTAYRELANDHMASFLNERVTKYSKPFKKLDDLRILNDEGQEIIYFCYIESHEKLLPVYNDITSLRDGSGNTAVKCAFYEDHYTPGLWYLEVFANTASKGSTCKMLRKITGAKTIVSFGDNGNDLSMFAESDYSFAVERAGDKIKAAADGVIPGELGIIDFIRNHI